MEGQPNRSRTYNMSDFFVASTAAVVSAIATSILLIAFGFGLPTTSNSPIWIAHNTLYDWQGLIGGIATFFAALVASLVAVRQFKFSRQRARAKVRADALISLQHCQQFIEHTLHKLHKAISQHGPHYYVQITQIPTHDNSIVNKATPLLEFEENEETRSMIERFVWEYLVVTNNLEAIRTGQNFDLGVIICELVTAHKLSVNLLQSLTGEIDYEVTKEEIKSHATKAGIETSSLVEKLLDIELTR